MASTERRASPPTSSGSSKQQQQHVLCGQTTVQQPAGSTLNLLFCFCSRNYRGFDNDLTDEVDLAVYILSTDPRWTTLMILTAFADKWMDIG